MLDQTLSLKYGFRDVTVEYTLEEELTTSRQLILSETVSEQVVQYYLVTVP